MSTQPVEQLHFGFYPHRDLLVQRHQGQITSDSGLIPLRQADQRLRYSERMTACLTDGRRQPRHTLA